MGNLFGAVYGRNVFCVSVKPSSIFSKKKRTQKNNVFFRTFAFRIHIHFKKNTMKRRNVLRKMTLSLMLLLATGTLQAQIVEFVRKGRLA
jgi:hypothetical protein